MYDDRTDIASEAASSIGTFVCSSGIYWMSTVKPYLFDFILLAIGSFLPSRVGVRMGCLAGILLGPPIVSELSKLTNWDTSLPQGFLDTMIFAGSNGKFMFGVFGGILGALAFIYFRRQRLFHRFWANVFASATTGLAIGVVWGLLLLILGFGNRHPPPNLISNLMIMGLKDTAMATALGAAIGIPLAAVDLISKRNRYD